MHDIDHGIHMAETNLNAHALDSLNDSCMNLVSAWLIKTAIKLRLALLAACACCTCCIYYKIQQSSTEQNNQVCTHYNVHA